MFEASTYTERRKVLREKVGSGVILFLGNDPAPMNYPDNPYHFKQDSSFLYFWGLDAPGLDVRDGGGCTELAGQPLAEFRLDPRWRREPG